MKTLEEVIKREIEKSKMHPIIHAEVNFIEMLDEWERTTRPCDVHIFYFKCAVSNFCNFQDRIIPVERIHFINSLNDMKKECIKRGYSGDAIDYISERIKKLKENWKL